VGGPFPCLIGRSVANLFSSPEDEADDEDEDEEEVELEEGEGTLEVNPMWQEQRGEEGQSEEDESDEEEEGAVQEDELDEEEEGAVQEEERAAAAPTSSTPNQTHQIPNLSISAIASSSSLQLPVIGTRPRSRSPVQDLINGFERRAAAGDGAAPARKRPPGGPWWRRGEGRCRPSPERAWLSPRRHRRPAPRPTSPKTTWRRT
jgi:hypothetical protein